MLFLIMTGVHVISFPMLFALTYKSNNASGRVHPVRISKSNTSNGGSNRSDPVSKSNGVGRTAHSDQVSAGEQISSGTTRFNGLLPA